MTPQRFAQRVHDDLRARRWLRWHCALIGAFTLLAAWASSHALMSLGADVLWLRYAASFLAAYSAFLLLLYGWARWLVSRDESDLSSVDPGTGGGSSGSGSGGSGNPRIDSPSFESGTGGDFGGAGAGGSFELNDLPSGAAEAAGNAAGSALDVVGSADEGVVILVPLALVIGIALAIGTALGFVVFGLFGVDVLLAVAVEVAIASASGALAFKAGAEGWLNAAWRRTRKAALVGLIGVMALGGAIDHWMPEARSLPQAVRLLRSS